MAHIDFEAKTDRELLVLVAQKSNETADHLTRINNILLKHEQRITILERSNGCAPTWKSSLKVNWQTLTLLASVLTLIMLELGQKVGWW